MKMNILHSEFFLLKEKFIVTSHGDNCRYKGNNVNITYILDSANHMIIATKETIENMNDILLVSTIKLIIHYKYFKRVPE